MNSDRRSLIDRVLAGRGRYVGDLEIPGLKHVAFVRSPCPHAQIADIDTTKARRCDGVVAVFTGADLQHTTGTMSHHLPDPPFQQLNWPLIPVDKVRFVGDPVAVVVADDPYLAEDAAECVNVSYTELPAVDDARHARQSGSPLLYSEWGTNVFVRSEFTGGDLASGFRSAAGIIQESFDHHRVCGFPLEGNGICAVVDETGRLLIHASTQSAHLMRQVVADVTGRRPADVRVTVPDVGGGFGLKQHVLREEMVTAVLATLLPHPVRWLQDASDTVAHGIHARAQHHEVEAAYTKDGKILALRIGIVADVGNPVVCYTGAGPAIVTAASIPGAYDIPAYEYTLDCVATNTPPVAGYRGFGQPEAVFTIERTLDLVARQTGLDAAQVRRVNMIPDAPRPFPARTGSLYDVGSVRDQFDHLLREIRYRPVDSHRVVGRDRLRGVGLACYVEPTAPNLHVLAGRYGAYEMVQMTIESDGEITVTVGTKDLGQGNLAAFRRIAADAMDVPVDRVVVRDGDTDGVPYSIGTWGSRTIVMGGAAILDAAHRLRNVLARIAAAQLDAEPQDVTFSDSRCHAAGGSVSYQEMASISYLHPFALPPGVPPGLTATGVYHAPHAEPTPDEHGRLNIAATYSGNVAAAAVEVELSTGVVEVTDFTLVYDGGNIVDPDRVLGQIQGAVAQGLSAVLIEEIDYRDGHTSAPKLGDYHVARAPDVPRVRAIPMCTPSALPGGTRGISQIGTILAPAAIANAIDDALSSHGVVVRQTNLTSRSIRTLLQSADLDTN
ncbi:xanthine dehydrogenase family protein molybdopterin-binding subunit [Mycolicibacterium boenickei]